MDLRYFSEVNARRCESPDAFAHDITDWSLSDWMTAAVGELGEAANVIKKLNRVRDGIPGNKETPEELQEMLGKELADAVCYIDLMATRAGFSLNDILADKFNEVSDRFNCDIKVEA